MKNLPHSCPPCGSTFVRRIPRTFMMRIGFVREHILCTNCGERSLIFPWVKQNPEKPIVRALRPHRPR